MNKSDILMFLQNCTCKKYCPLPPHNICKLVERERVTLEKRDTLHKETHFVFFLVTDVSGSFEKSCSYE